MPKAQLHDQRGSVLGEGAGRNSPRVLGVLISQMRLAIAHHSLHPRLERGYTFISLDLDEYRAKSPELPQLSPYLLSL